MDFHVTQPGSSVATSLIDGESKPKHVLLLEIKVCSKFRNRIDTIHPHQLATSPRHLFSICESNNFQIVELNDVDCCFRYLGVCVTALLHMA